MTDPGDHPVPALDGTGAMPVPDDATITWRRPSPLLLRVRRIEVAVVTVPLAIAGGLAGAVGLRRRWRRHRGRGGRGGGLLGERFLARRVAAWGYAERKDDLMVRRGVLIRRQSVIPYGRMQFIDVTAGPLERSHGPGDAAHAHGGGGQRRPHSRPGAGRGGSAPRSAAALGEAQAAGL